MSVMQVSGIATKPVVEGELVEVMVESPAPGEECFGCHRKVPQLASDENTGPRREVMSLSIPKGEEGVLESMLVALVDKYQEQWPRDYAEMRAGIGLEVVGGRSWKYYAIVFSVYACLTVSGLEPKEEGA